jgi:Cdc6-like AAA superfamily ATPase
MSIASLWLHGIPGCGKSVLSSTIIRDLQQTSDGTECTLLYFYFNFNDSRKQTFDQLVRTVIFQLYQQHIGCRKVLDQLYGSCRDGGEQPQLKALETTLHSMIAETDGVSIVLDALDECQTRRELLPWLQSLNQESVRVLVTSRKEGDIESSLMKWMSPTSVVSIQHTAVDNDIRAVVRSRLVKDTDFERWRSSPEVRDRIEHELMAKADGM